MRWPQMAGCERETHTERTVSPHTSTAFLAVKKHQVLFPTTKEQHIALVNFSPKPSVSTHLMAIVALVTIRLIHLL
jgi:hypothetical protein